MLIRFNCQKTNRLPAILIAYKCKYSTIPWYHVTSKVLPKQQVKGAYGLFLRRNVATEDGVSNNTTCPRSISATTGSNSGSIKSKVSKNPQLQRKDDIDINLCLIETRFWLEDFVCRHKLCPWAITALQADQVRIVGVDMGVFPSSPDDALGSEASLNRRSGNTKNSYSSSDSILEKRTEEFFSFLIDEICALARTVGYSDEVAFEIARADEAISDAGVPGEGKGEKRVEGKGERKNDNINNKNAKSSSITIAELNSNLTIINENENNDESDSKSIKNTELEMSEIEEKNSDTDIRTTRLPSERKITTTAIVVPYYKDFEKYLEVFEEIESFLEESKLSEYVQVASFHPKYVFADSLENEDDCSNWTNRSPYPIFHLLRVPDVSKAIDQVHGKTEDIWKRNIKLMRTVGIDKLKMGRLEIRRKSREGFEPEGNDSSSRSSSSSSSSIGNSSDRKRLENKSPKGEQAK